LVETERFERGTKLSCQNRGLGCGILVKAGIGRVVEKGDRAHNFVAHDQGSGQDRGRGAQGELWIAGHVHVIVEDGAAALHSFEGDRLISRPELHSSKALRVDTVAFGADQITVRSTPRKVGTAGMKKLAGLLTEREDELVRVAVLKNAARKFQQQSLESLLRVRRLLGHRVSPDSGQPRPLGN
jgi:hypothetical protein